MKANLHNASSPARRPELKLSSACDFAAVRETVRAARNWLASWQVSESELNAWELALVEAGNNAVEYAPAEAAKLPVGLELALDETEVEARIIDHTPGFDLSGQLKLPEPDSEGGRGLFIIKAATDAMAYVRGPRENRMILRKRRDHSQPSPPAGGKPADPLPH